MGDKTVIKDGLVSNLYATNEQPIDMHSSLYENYPAMAPLTAIFAKLSQDEAFLSRIDWQEDEMIPDTLIMTADSASGATALTSSQFLYARAYDMYINPQTKERLIVDATPTTSTITVTRGWGLSDTAAISAGTILRRIGNAYPENSEASNPRHVVNSNFFNFTQEVVKHTQHSTRAMYEITHFGGKGDKRTKNNRKMFYDFRREMELAIMFGSRGNAIMTSETNYTKTMGGIMEKLYNGTNYFNFNGVLTESKIDGWLTDIYTQFPDSTNLLAVCAPRVYTRWNQIAKPLIRLSPNSKQYGMNLKQYDGAVTLDLIKHPLLTGSGFDGMMFILDLSFMGIKWQKRPELELDTAMKRFNYTEDKLHALITFMAANEARHAMGDGILG